MADALAGLAINEASKLVGKVVGGYSSLEEEILEEELDNIFS